MAIQEGDIIKYENGDTIVQGKVIDIRSGVAEVRLNWPTPAFRGHRRNYVHLPVEKLTCV